MNYYEAMKFAYMQAVKSPDPSSQNGAVLARQKWGGLQLLCSGYNHFYNGTPAVVDDRDEKLRWIEHAERDVIYTSIRQSRAIPNMIMVCPWAACSDCARAIIGSGINTLVVHKERMDLTDDRWKGQVDQALDSMTTAGINIEVLEGSIPGSPAILVSGQLWSPDYLEFLPPSVPQETT